MASSHKRLRRDDRCMASAPRSTLGDGPGQLCHDREVRPRKAPGCLQDVRSGRAGCSLSSKPSGGPRRSVQAAGSGLWGRPQAPPRVGRFGAWPGYDPAFGRCPAVGGRVHETRNTRLSGTVSGTVGQRRWRPQGNALNSPTVSVTLSQPFREHLQQRVVQRRVPGPQEPGQTCGPTSPGVRQGRPLRWLATPSVADRPIGARRATGTPCRPAASLSRSRSGGMAEGTHLETCSSRCLPRRLRSPRTRSRTCSRSA